MPLTSHIEFINRKHKCRLLHSNLDSFSDTGMTYNVNFEGLLLRARAFLQGCHPDELEGNVCSIQVSWDPPNPAPCSNTDLHLIDNYMNVASYFLQNPYLETIDELGEDDVV